jgi:NCAIR mutase (PurE)-related protein
MDALDLDQLLGDVREGTVSVDEAVAALRHLPFADLGFARVDHHRALRQGMPEAIYAPGKRPDHLAAIVAELLGHGTGPVLVTRADESQVAAALAVDPSGVTVPDDRPVIGLATVTWRAAPALGATAVVVTAGTSDLPVAQECAATLAAYGIEVVLLPDCGVAGLHRLLSSIDALLAADAVVVVAGMEGALASVVGGLTSVPIVAVPTSVGYGAGLEGVTALLAMHASCAAGVTVVGIDNGYGAACAVARTLR